jgi:hypothetical protein
MSIPVRDMMFSLSLSCFRYGGYCMEICVPHQAADCIYTGPTDMVHCIIVVLLIAVEMSLSHTMYIRIML